MNQTVCEPRDSFLRSVTALLWLCKSCATEAAECPALCLHNTLLTARLKYNSGDFLSFSAIPSRNQELLFFFLIQACGIRKKKKKSFEADSSIFGKSIDSMSLKAVWRGARFTAPTAPDLSLIPALVNPAYGARWGSDKCCVCMLRGENRGRDHRIRETRHSITAETKEAEPEGRGVFFAARACCLRPASWDYC